MGAIERNGYTFEPEYSVTRQNGAIHVYRRGEFVEEIPFDFRGEFPEHDLIEELVNHYCYENKI
ncbi:MULTISPECIES: YbxH family protein [Bacillus]|uniref:YbxH family protein n=1 Tax=Bacillus TaxID=1386 RepID=UPI0003F740DC|nr:MULTISPECIES: YbxH family protein [Bacillus]QHZ48841.1 YbxH family protein [Bacillus sp. NSP9.1]WFA05522.1 YbxH family protein [Bacillus sp. HSf4]